MQANPLSKSELEAIAREAALIAGQRVMVASCGSSYLVERVQINGGRHLDVYTRCEGAHQTGHVLK